MMFQSVVTQLLNSSIMTILHLISESTASLPALNLTNRAHSEPPHFHPGDVDKDKWFFTTHDKDEVPDKWSVGTMDTGYHGYLTINHF
jgi:hypothetical protein